MTFSLRHVRRLAGVCLWGLLAGTAGAQRAHPLARPEIDPALARVLAETPAIDNHAHPLLTPPSLATDREFDALPVDNMEPQTDPVAWRPDFPPLAEAWEALWGYRGQPPLTAEAQAQL